MTLPPVKPFTLATLLAATLSVAPAWLDAAPNAEAEIEYLLNFVATSDCVFIRNGDRHAASRAAEHLAMKYKRSKRHMTTAERFIDKLASQSSLSGREYEVNCAGETQQAAPWLYAALASYRRETRE